MTGLRSLEGLGPGAYDRTMMGTVVDLGGGVLGVNVLGNNLAARWIDPVVVSVNDTVLVQLTIGKTGQTEAFVKGRLVSKSRPGRGTVTAGGSPTITVTGSDGATYTANYLVSYTPTVGDEVFMSWFGPLPMVLGKVPTSPPAPPQPLPPPPIAPPPARVVADRSTYVATQSGSYMPGMGWDRHGGGKGRVFQGQNNGSGLVYGSWFYRGSPGELSGKTVNRLQIALGARMPVGDFNAPVKVHFYLHTSGSRPAFGDVTRTSGPYDVTAAAGQILTYYDLPTAWASSIIAGGGVSIALDPYAGFRGVNEQPDSGKLIFDWS